MLGPGGVQIKNRRYNLTLYKSCAVGSEMVDWLEKNEHISRAEAVTLGQQLIDEMLIYHVAFEKPFIDGFFFYRFDRTTIANVAASLPTPSMLL